ncbi:MAG: lytic transglycosylase [Deltaproteobacteria bacterium]|nr:lytic transglycosylase [Deltaproteobacteria bacterium]
MPLAESRIRSSLGGLVRVATQHRRSGSPAEADRVMASVRSTVGDLGLHPSVTQALTDAYDARYDERTREKTRVQQPLAARGARNRLQRAPAGRHGFDRLIRAKASNHDIDPALVKAVVAAESNFDEHAVSRTGAQGLMQLMPRTAEELGVIFPFDPAQNLDGGVRYLRAMLDRFGDTSMALAAYNAGPDAVVRYGGIPPYPETQEYVERVLQLYATYQNDRLN